MKKLIYLVVLVLGFAYADIKVEVLPKEPVVGESFNVVFKINVKDGNDPLINFEPSNIEVLSRQESGVSTRTTYINGKLTVERTIEVTYEMVSARATTAYLKDIEVEIGGQLYKHKRVRIPILKVAKKEKDVFLRAEADKTEVFLGESIIVRYYLYHRNQLNNMEIKKFPSLDKFMKRFHQEPQSAQRVQLNSGIYYRRIVYTAQLFSNKVGKAKIDPMTVGVTYPYGRSANSMFGFGFGNMKTRTSTLRSQPVEIITKALPDNPPAGFTGLVGKHEFDFKINKNKFLVNEPIEIDFTVKGEGNLEMYEEPKFIDSQKVEDFDANSDLVIQKNFTANKKFKITYLARENGNINEKTIPLVYFDTKTLQFVTKIITIGAIKIAGKSFSAEKTGGNDNVRKLPTPQNNSKVKKQLDLNPIYKLKNTLYYNKWYIFGFLFLIFFILSFKSLFSYLFRSGKKVEMSIFELIKSEGADYGRFYDLIRLLSDKGLTDQIIQDSGLSEKVKEELLKKYSLLEDQFNNKQQMRVKVSNTALKEIQNSIKPLHG